MGRDKRKEYGQNKKRCWANKTERPQSVRVNSRVCEFAEREIPNISNHTNLTQTSKGKINAVENYIWIK